MSKPLHIALFWDYYGPYHYARLRALKSHAESESVKVTAIELAGHSNIYAWSRIKSEGDVLTLFPDSRPDKISAIRVYFNFRKILRERAIDVLLVPSYWPGYSFAATVAARTLGIDVVVMADSHYESGKVSFPHVWAKRCLLKFYSAALLAGARQHTFFRYLGMPSERIFDGYDGVDNEYFAHQAERARGNETILRSELALPRRYILSLGRLVEKKNNKAIIYAYASLAKANKLAGVHLVFVGSGPERTSLEQLADDLGILVFSHDSGQAKPSDETSYGIHFHPFAQIDKTPIYLSLAECFILASKVEEWGLVVNEAMACGCPALVSRQVGCAQDLVKVGVNGYHFSPTNSEELAWSINQLLSAPEKARTMGREAQRLLLSEWGVRRFAVNALRASRVANRLGPIGRLQSESDMGEEVILLQAAFPDYRIPVYRGLREKIGSGFKLYTGMSYFTPDVKTCSEFQDWIHIVQNHFFWRRRLLSQHETLPALIGADVVLMELNPRIVTNWLILLMRWLWDRPTLLWGHAWGRSGSRSVWNVWRIMMMRMANAVVTYTHSQRQELQAILRKKQIYTAPNSLFPRHEFEVADVAPDDLTTIIYVGRLNASKKPILLLNGFIEAIRTLPGCVELCVIGEGAEREQLILRASAAGVSHRVRLLGHVSNRGILRENYAKAFCAVSPGYVGLSAIQAFSFGVPMVIAKDEDHAPEIEACMEGENTLFFDSNDVEALREALVRMWNERTEWARRRRAISDDTALKYSTDTMVDALARAIMDARGNSKI